jgi:excisionase family DNA binding protein
MSTHSFNYVRTSEDWVSQADAARIRGVSRQAIGRLLKKGRFRVLKIGGKVLLKRSDVESFKPEQPGRPPK